MRYTIRPLDASTWAVFAELAERNNGIFGGCWCMGYHPERGQQGISYRTVKQDRVRTGRAHAALVIDEDGSAQRWCQYGSPEELPRIKHKREYDKDPPPRSAPACSSRATKPANRTADGTPRRATVLPSPTIVCAVHRLTSDIRRYGRRGGIITRAGISLALFTLARICTRTASCRLIRASICG